VLLRIAKVDILQFEAVDACRRVRLILYLQDFGIIIERDTQRLGWSKWIQSVDVAGKVIFFEIRGI